MSAYGSGFRKSLLIACFAAVSVRCYIIAVEGRPSSSSSSPSSLSASIELREVCSREPSGSSNPGSDRSAGDGGMRIRVVGHTDLYSPGQVYTIVLDGSFPSQRFIGFMLSVVPRHARDETTIIGTFQIIDQVQSQFMSMCPHIVTHTDLQVKAEIELLWIAPASRSGCVEFRATVIEKPGVWFKDDGALTKIFCEDTGLTEDSRTKDMIPDCCACGIANYQFTIESRWNNNNYYPKDASPNELHQTWDVFGVTHSKKYMMWQYGADASKAITDVCRWGSSESLDEEIKIHKHEIHGIINASMTRWRELEESNRKERWRRFNTDTRRHLISVLTRVGETQDWCTGVSALDLCLSNCTWADDRRIELSPFQIGLRSSKDEEQQIISSHSDNKRFSSTSDQLGKRVAVLHIQRIRSELNQAHGTNPCIDNIDLDSNDFHGRTKNNNV